MGTFKDNIPLLQVCPKRPAMPLKVPFLASPCPKTLAGALVNVNFWYEFNKWLCCTDVELLKMILFLF